MHLPLLHAAVVDVTTTASTGPGSLADAVAQANSGTCASPCSIEFGVTGTIQLTSPLVITATEVTIDGYTAPGASTANGPFGSPDNAQIKIGVTTATSVGSGLILLGDDATIRGIAIYGFQDEGVLIDGTGAATPSGNAIIGCFIGVTANGNAAAPNGIGVAVRGQNASHNLIGIGRASTNPGGNGTGRPADRNLISANVVAEISVVDASFTAMSGNYLGVAASGAAMVAPASSGITVTSTGPLVSGTVMGAQNANGGNVIAGHAGDGVAISGNVSGTVMNGNRIGLALSGNAAIGNATGIALNGVGTTTIGGLKPNVVSGNATGISITSPAGNITIQNNLVGTNVSGTAAVGNSGYGVQTAGADHNVTITSNTIAFNGGGGVMPGGAGVVIRGNAIYGNGGLPIDLSGTSTFILNDGGDSDSGNNGLQNYPSLTDARVADGLLYFNFSLDSSAVSQTHSVAIELFKADAGGQAVVFLGTAGCFAGNAFTNVAASVPAGILADGDHVAATATSYANLSCTNPNDGTSELSSPATPSCFAASAAITAPASLCPSSVGNVASVPANGAATFVWNITNGTITGGQGTNSIMFSVATASSATVGVTVTANACPNFSSVSIPIESLDPTITAPSTVIAGSSGNAASTQTYSSASYLWSITGGSITGGAGTSSITFTAGTGSQVHLSVTIDRGSCSVTDSKTITVIPPLAITTPSLPNGSTGFPYTTTLSAIGGTGSYSWSLSSGSLPNGLSLAPNGTISGTPTQSGNFVFTVGVTDGSDSTTKQFTIAIANGLTIATTFLPQGTVGVAYSASLSAIGGSTPYSWSLFNGSLPPGLSLASNGEISGIPLVTIESTFKVEVQDDNGETRVATLKIRIGGPLTIITNSLPPAGLGTGYMFQLIATGGEPVDVVGYFWTIIGGSLPSGFSLSWDGVISGQGDSETTSLVTIQVSDQSHSVQREFIFQVRCDAGSPPVPVASAIREVTGGVSYSVSWTAGHAGSYDVQEARDSEFTEPSTTSVAINSAPFVHTVVRPTSYFYRVRTHASCNPELVSDWSAPIRVVVTPIAEPHSRRFEITIPEGYTDPIVFDFFIPGPGIGGASGIVRSSASASDTGFTTTTSVPWMTTAPPTGTVPTGGTIVSVTVTPVGLPVGSSTGVITVTNPNSGSTITSANVTVSVVTPVALGPIATSPDTLVIPAVAHIDGATASYASDLRIGNTGSTVARFEVALTRWGSDDTAETTTFNVDPGSTVLLDDVVRHLFGFGSMESDGAAGTISIHRLDSNHDPLSSLAWSHLYSGDLEGRIGQFVQAIALGQFAGTGHTLSLQHVAQNPSARTNLGLLEGSGAAASVLVSIFDPHGAKLGEFPFNLGPGEHTQINSVLAAHDITLDDGRVEVKVLSETGTVTAYASVVDSETSDASLVPATDPSLLNASHYVLPGILHLDSGNAHWRSDVRIFSSSTGAAALTLTFVPLNGGTPLQRNVTLAPSEVAELDDVVLTLFGVSDLGGALHVDAGMPTPLVVTSRTYNDGPAGAYGQFIEAVTPEQAIGAGDPPQYIIGIEQSSATRTNVGVFETTGSSASVELTVSNPDGRTAGRVMLDLGPFEYVQISSLLEQLGLTNVFNGTVQIRVTGGDGRVGSYASMINNLSGDPLYIPAQ